MKNAINVKKDNLNFEETLPFRSNARSCSTGNKEAPLTLPSGSGYVGYW